MSRPLTTAERRERVERTAALRRSGASDVAIAAALGCSDGEARRLLRAADEAAMRTASRKAAA